MVLPLPRMSGFTIKRYSSIKPAWAKETERSELPKMIMSLPGCPFQFQNLIRDILFHQAGIVPVHFIQGLRKDKLGFRVHLFSNDGIVLESHSVGQ